MKGSYGRVDMGAVMAAFDFGSDTGSYFYLSCQKHIIKGVGSRSSKRLKKLYERLK